MNVNSMKDNTEDDIADTNIDNPLTEEEVSKNKSDEDEVQTEKKNEELESEVEANYVDINTDTILQTAAEETISALEYKVAELKEELSKEKSQAEETINIMKYDVAKLKEELSKEKSEAEETTKTLNKEKAEAIRAEAEKTKILGKTEEYKLEVQGVPEKSLL